MKCLGLEFKYTTNVLTSHNLNYQSFLGPNDYNHDDEMIIKTQSELDGAKRLWKKDK